MNIAYLLTRTASKSADQIATIYGEAQQTYGVLNRRVSRLADALKRLGVPAGGRVGIICDSEPRGLESLLGPLRAGLVLVPMNPKLHPAEHAYILGNCRASAVLCGPRYARNLMEIREKLPADMAIIAFDAKRSGLGSALDYDELLEGAGESVEDAAVSGDDLAWIFYTSGTTGNPKGAMLSHRNLLTMAMTQMLDVTPVKSGDRLAYVAPISHSSGLMAFQHIARGAGHVFPTYQSFSAKGYFDLVERCEVTTTFMVPTMIQLLLEEPSRDDYDLSSLHTIVYGGSPMYVDRLRDAIGVFGRIFVQIFAQGEAPMACTVLPKDEHVLDCDSGVRRLASAGRECVSVEVRIVDADGKPLPADATGEIVVRSDLVMKGYWNDSEATARTLQGGWLHTGDIGHMDDQGYLFITDRSKDMIITGGYNVYPREIEEILYRHPAVREASVFGIPDRKWGESIVVALSLRGEADVSSEEIVNYCRDNLAGYKKPSAVHFLDALPKSGYDKILKRELRRMLYPDVT